MRLAPLSFAFLLSGIAGISYELVWVHYVGRVVGGSTPAIAATVAFFLAGLALGAALFGRRFDRARHPLRAYALLELAIGACAALTPSALLLVERVLPATTSTPTSLLVCAVVLLPPTTLLGATFPAMARAISLLRGPVEGTARFYGINTLGGMLGGLLAAFWLIPALGYASTNLLMTSFNGAAALLLFALHLRADRTEHSTDTNLDARPNGPATIAFRAALVISFGSGFAAISVEVLWTRALALSFPGTVYVFAVVLAAYLAGIGLGSLLLVPLTRRVGAKPLLPLLYLATAFGVLTSGALLPSLTDLFFSLVRRGVIGSWHVYIGGVGTAVFGAMLPASLAMGAALPLLIGLSSRERSRDAGRIYAANIAGGVIGSLATTFALMPALGLSRLLALGAATYLAIGTSLTPLIEVRVGVRRALVALTAVVAIAAFFGLHPEAGPALKARADQRTLYHRDAPSGTITIQERREGARRVRALEINSFYGLNETGVSTVAMQYRLGHLPLLAHGQAKSALLIGFATGSTLAAMAEHRLRRLDCVEIHADLLELAPYFSRANHEVYSRPDVTLHAVDGRRYVLSTTQKYDVIISDLFLPRNPGVAALYSQEHFAAARARLHPGGIFTLWLPLWQLAPWEAGVIVHTFLAVFPHAEGLISNKSHARPALGLFGSTRQLIAAAELGARVRPHLLRSLRRAFGPSATIRLSTSLRRVPTDALRRWAARKPLNTLDWPIIEFSAPKTLIAEQLARRRGGLASANLRLIERFTRSFP